MFVCVCARAYTCTSIYEEGDSSQASLLRSLQAKDCMKPKSELYNTNVYRS